MRPIGEKRLYLGRAYIKKYYSMLLLIAWLISFVMVSFMVPKMLMLSLRKRLIDPINSRKVHSVPASRLGGVTFFPALLFSFWFTLSLTNIEGCEYLPLVLPSVGLVLKTLALLVLFLAGIYDDVLGISFNYKFIIQAFVAILLVWSGTYLRSLHGLFGIYEISDYIAYPLSILLYIFIINAINFIDGIDGLASLLSIMILLVFGSLFIYCDMLPMSMLTFATLGALIPFSYHNLFGVKSGARSKIFMGDTGSLVIGAVLSFTAIELFSISSDATPLGSRYYIWAYTMLLLPCFDVVRVVIHRYKCRKSLFLPDKSHTHHKFIALGYTQRQSLAFIFLMSIGFIILNLLLSHIVTFLLLIVIDVVIWTLLHIHLSNILMRRSGKMLGQL